MSDEEIINGEAATALRSELGMTQEDFWGALGVKRETGRNYEVRGRIPVPVQRLLFMHYVAGIPMSPPSTVMRIGRIANATADAEFYIQLAAESLKAASSQVRTAFKAITEEAKETQ